MRKLTYKVTADGHYIEPSVRKWAGMQGEDNVTEVVFDLSVLNYKNALYRIDFSSASAGDNPGENVKPNNGKISRLIPFDVTQYGGEVQVTAVVTILDSEGRETGTELTYPVIVYFTEVKARNGKEICKSVSAAEASALDAAERAETAANEAKSSEDAAKEAAETTLHAQRELEEGTTIVFEGGDAQTETNVDLVVDSILSEGSINPIENGAVAAAINSLREYITKELTDLKQYAPIKAGVSNGWNYRQYRDGTLECWRKVSASLTVDQQWPDAPNHYYSAIQPVYFPDVEGIRFIETPCLTVSVDNENGNFLYTKKSTSKDDTGAIYVVSLQQYTTAQDIVFYLNAKGKWRGEEV